MARELEVGCGGFAGEGFLPEIAELTACKYQKDIRSRSSPLAAPLSASISAWSDIRRGFSRRSSVILPIYPCKVVAGADGYNGRTANQGKAHVRAGYVSRIKVEKWQRLIIYR